MLNSKKSHVTYEKLGEQCCRSVAIVERHSDKSAAIASHGEMLLPVIRQFCEMREQLTVLRSQGREAMQEALREIEGLYHAIRAWFGPLQYALEGFDSRDFGFEKNMPDSVLHAAGSLIEYVRSLEAETGTTPPFTARLVDDLTARRDLAASTWLAAQDLLAAEQELRNDIREASLRTQRALVSIRRTLRATLGAGHRDYQKMRLRRGRRDDVEQTESMQSAESIEAARPAQSVGKVENARSVSMRIEQAAYPFSPAGLVS